MGVIIIIFWGVWERLESESQTSNHFRVSGKDQKENVEIKTT